MAIRRRRFYGRIHRDPEVTRYLNRPVDAAAVGAFYGQVVEHWDRHGFGFFAAESTEQAIMGALLGFVGVAYPSFLPALAHRTELGWRLEGTTWGRPAHDAAREAGGHDVSVSLPRLGGC